MSKATTQEQSAKLISVLQEKISHHGGILSFADYMDTVLYHPQYGYYQRPILPMGAKGDFITAPELSPLFADCLATECATVFKALDQYDCIELGAGSGQLAIDLMRTFTREGVPIERYIIIEVSHTLRSVQKERIKAALTQKEYEKFVWLDAVPAGFMGVVLANEVLDALPCHTFSFQDDIFLERGVSAQGGRLHFEAVPIFSEGLAVSLANLQKTVEFPPHYASEINLRLQPFLEALTTPMRKAVLFFIDYGYGQQEYYHPNRSMGTLSCFYQHQYHADPFNLPGLQDITAHVNFTQLADCALQHGLAVLGFTSQASFLLGLGLLERAAVLESGLSAIEQFQLHQAIKRLTFPMEMGETIKIMALAKGCEDEALSLTGFKLRDRRGEL